MSGDSSGFTPGAVCMGVVRGCWSMEGQPGSQQWQEMTPTIHGNAGQLPGQAACRGDQHTAVAASGQVACSGRREDAELPAWGYAQLTAHA